MLSRNILNHVSPFNASSLNLLISSFPKRAQERNGYLSFSSSSLTQRYYYFFVFRLSLTSIEANLLSKRTFQQYVMPQFRVYNSRRKWKLLDSSASSSIRAKRKPGEKYFGEIAGKQTIIPGASCIVAAHAIDSSS